MSRFEMHITLFIQPYFGLWTDCSLQQTGEEFIFLAVEHLITVAIFKQCTDNIH